MACSANDLRAPKWDTTRGCQSIAARKPELGKACSPRHVQHLVGFLLRNPGELHEESCRRCRQRHHRSRERYAIPSVDQPPSNAADVNPRLVLRDRSRHTRP